MSELPGPPTPRRPGEYHLAVVCLGNICRSPMAHVVLEARLADAGLADRVTVTSAGTGGWHVGDPMDRRAAAALTAAGYDASRHRARQVEPGRIEELDLVLAMDEQNLADLLPANGDGSTDRDEARVRLFRDFDPREPGGEVPDPYYGGPDGFEEVLGMVERTAATLVDRLAGLLPASGSRRR